VEIAAENNSTTVFPIPLDIFRPFIEKAGPADPETTVKALKHAAETMVEGLPDTEDKTAVAAAARKMIGLGDLTGSAGAAEKERVPAGEREGSEASPDDGAEEG
jgi:hypothetical protein